MTGTKSSDGYGTAVVLDSNGTAHDLGNVSSGLQGLANNPTFSSLKDGGALPIGTYGLTHDERGTNQFKLAPVAVPAIGDRDSFLIHGFKKGQTPLDASTGCLILDANQRESLKSHFDGCKGKMFLQVKRP